MSTTETPGNATWQLSPSDFIPQFLNGFATIHSPRWNYHRNIETLYYRMSELSFGSLLVAYLLGFITFAAALFLPPQQGDYPLLLAQSVTTHNFLLFYQQILTSAIFSCFTALLYISFHQSLVYLSLDLKDAAKDFILSLSTGLLFGLSMLFPLTIMFCISLLTFLALVRKVAALKHYGEHVCVEVASRAGWHIPGSSPIGKKIRREIVKWVMPIVMAELRATPDPVVSSWGRGFTPFTFIATTLIMTISLLLFVLEWANDSVTILFSEAMDMLVNVNVVLTTVVAIYLFSLLMRAGGNLASEQQIRKGVLDEKLIRVLEQVQKRLEETPDYKRPGFERRPPAPLSSAP